MNRLPLIALAAVLVLSDVPSDAEAGARRSRPLKTGLTTCFDTAGTVIPCAGTAQDGDLQRGEPRAYQDNGDGTIRDKRAALTWEKLSDDDSIHDKDNLYTWAKAFEKIDALNAPPCLGGFCDWRLPNLNELESIRSLGTEYPAAPAAFDTGCSPGCTAIACSCTLSDAYWTSSSFFGYGQLAWIVYFDIGVVSTGLKTNTYGVRAVRGGS